MIMLLLESQIYDLLPQARIALERRHFLENAAAAVRKQSLWSNLAHEMTAEYRALCAEEVLYHIGLLVLSAVQCCLSTWLMSETVVTGVSA